MSTQARVPASLTPAAALAAEAIGSERRLTVVRRTVELVEVTRQGRREGTRCRGDLIPPNKLKHKGWDGLGSSIRVRVGTARCHQPQRSWVGVG